jgi:crotonobetainyl-CoA:carnitine CoA-transferase CaiB-like acyl-CoA transferase
MIEVTLDAHDWCGPWAGRRGFDNLKQMSSGIADAGIAHRRRGEPAKEPVSGEGG